MSDKRTVLQEVASLLGYSCQNDTSGSAVEAVGVVESSQRTPNNNSENSDDFVAPCSVTASCISYPSFSLTHQQQHHSQQQQQLQNSPSREEVELKASACMAQQIHLNSTDGGVPNVNLNALLKDAPCRMLENILDSFDHLVDARLHQYSKVLRNHGQSLSTAGQQIVEYKLRTLLEIGTNISFGSISTKFTTATTIAAESTELPILLIVEMDSLQFHHPTQQQHVQQKIIRFQAPGKIQQGIYETDRADDSCHNRLVKDDAHPSSSSKRNFKSLTVRVDCETLLKEMMEQAGEIVGVVVELTNQAWVEQQQAQAEQDTDAADDDADTKVQEQDDSSRKRKSLNEEPEGSRSPKLGAKTVSELSFHPPVKEVSTSAASAASFLESPIQDELKRPSLLHAYPMAAARDSDDENTNPSISAEKARHIIDFVFDEIDDAEFVPAPPPAKKPRIDA